MPISNGCGRSKDPVPEAPTEGIQRDAFLWQGVGPVYHQVEDVPSHTKTYLSGRLGNKAFAFLRHPQKEHLQMGQVAGDSWEQCCGENKRLMKEKLGEWHHPFRYLGSSRAPGLEMAILVRVISLVVGLSRQLDCFPLLT